MAPPREAQRCTAHLDDTEKYKDRKDIDLGHSFSNNNNNETGDSSWNSLSLWYVNTDQWTILHAPLLFYNTHACMGIMHRIARGNRAYPGPGYARFPRAILRHARHHEKARHPTSCK